VNLLRDKGYTVDYKGEGGASTPDYRYWRTLDAAKIAELEAADLLIVSRNGLGHAFRHTDSQYYDDGTEIAQWNAITKPMICLSAYMPRSSRWGWINTTSQTSGADPILEAVLPNHPIFRDVPLGAGNQVDIFSPS
jgi:hypothetical protein